MKIAKCNNKFYKLVLLENIDKDNIEIWLTDFNDKVYLKDNHYMSFDYHHFYKAETITTYPEIANMFFKIKGN